MAQRHTAQPRPLLPELWPLTGAYAFLDAPIANVGEVLTGWRRGLGREPQEDGVSGSLAHLLKRLTPMSLGYRELLRRTDSPWTAYFADHQTGADEAPVSYLAKVLRCRALYLIRWPVAGHEALRFQLIADHPPEFLNYERTVHMGTDDNGRKVFIAVGTVQPYEEAAAYRSRRVLDRLTPAKLEAYSRAPGYAHSTRNFFLRDGLLVVARDERPDVRFTIAEQQARYGYVPGAN